MPLVPPYIAVSMCPTTAVPHPRTQVMIVGVVVLGWWMAELAALFLFSALVVGVVSLKSEPRFVHHFLAGASDMVCFS